METPITSLLEGLVDTRSEQKERAFLSLLTLGDQALPCLIGALSMKKYAPAWPLLIQIIQIIGTHASIDDAIPPLLRFLKDSNKPIYEVAYKSLLTMGDVVLYNARDILAYCWSDDVWIQEVCVLLTNMNTVHLDMLVPEILHLFEIGTDENCLDEHVIDLLCKIGSPKANAVVPLLQEKILSRNRESIRHASIEALQYFDPSIIRPLIPLLRECLSDPSEAIRSSAKKVLEALDEMTGET